MDDALDRYPNAKDAKGREGKRCWILDVSREFGSAGASPYRGDDPRVETRALQGAGNRR